MKYLVFTRVFFFLILLSGNVYAVADDLITKQIVINVKQAGTLSTHIGNSKKNKITDLKLTGELNGTDFLFIREMAGAPSIAIEPIGNAGNLKHLDLSDAKIVSGGSSYFSYDQYNYCHTKDDVIGKSMFYGCAGIEDLIIPTNVTSIDDGAFASCYSLTKLTIPSGVTSIGCGAFQMCKNLAQVNIPSGVSTIDINTFRDCSSLTKLVIPSSVAKINDGAFEDCTNLTDLVIPYNVISIGNSAFKNCCSLTKLVIPSSVTYIGNCAFQNCSNLNNIAIPSSVNFFGLNALNHCEKLTEINYYIYDKLEDYLTKGHPDFYVDKKIKYYINDREIVNLDIPTGVTVIGYNAFYNSNNLTSLTIPSGVTSIDENAFKGCEGLTCLKLPSSITSLGENAFNGCCGLTSIYAYMSDPHNISSSVFKEVDKQHCILYVPKDTYQSYWLADGWGEFTNIVELDVTGIKNMLYFKKSTKTKYFSPDGHCLTAPTKGVNIVKYNNGSVRKEMMK